MKSQHITKTLVLVIFLLVTVSGPLHPGEGPGFKIQQVSGDVYCLYGPGGNIAILKGQKGLLVVDAQFARTAAGAQKKIRELSPLPIRYLVNTHHHGDHTDGNPIIGKGAEIVGHKNCRASMLKRLKSDQTAETIGAPRETFEKEMRLRLGNETIRLVHFGPAHTAGDTVVVFENAGVIHTGDLFFNGMAPYIDVEAGSDTGNWVQTIVELSKKYPHFKVIPGHGPVTDMKEFLEFAEYLQYLRRGVQAALKEGKTREETQKSIALGKYNHVKDTGTYFTKENNIGWIYDEMTRRKPSKAVNRGG